jgi:hypothetical protein
VPGAPVVVNVTAFTDLGTAVSDPSADIPLP